jgi:hypothetical protein
MGGIAGIIGGGLKATPDSFWLFEFEISADGGKNHPYFLGVCFRWRNSQVVHVFPTYRINGN